MPFFMWIIICIMLEKNIVNFRWINGIFPHSKRKIWFCTKRTLNWSLKEIFQNGTNHRLTWIEWSLVNWIHWLGASLFDKKEYLIKNFYLSTNHKDFNHSSKYNRTSYSLKFSRSPSIFSFGLLENNRAEINKVWHCSRNKKPTVLFIYHKTSDMN